MSRSEPTPSRTGICLRDVSARTTGIRIQVHQNGLGFELEGLLEADATVLGELDLAVTETLQDLAGHLLIDKIVFDDCTGQQSSS